MEVKYNLEDGSVGNSDTAIEEHIESSTILYITPLKYKTGWMINIPYRNIKHTGYIFYRHPY